MSVCENIGAYPVGQLLRPKYEGTFAHKTIKKRLPIILKEAIDYLAKNTKELSKRYGEDVEEDAKKAIERLYELRTDIKENNRLRLLKDDGDDVKMWNDSITTMADDMGDHKLNWYQPAWIFVESYMYRRIREAILLCETKLRTCDVFEEMKVNSLKSGQENISELIKEVRPGSVEKPENNKDVLKDQLRVILEGLLWSNKNDLSLSNGQCVNHKVNNLVQLLDGFREFILCDQTEDVFECIMEIASKTPSKDAKRPTRIDVILDNCGIELTSDLILCDWLITNNLVDVVHVHGKAYTWYVSDVVQNDFDLLMEQLKIDQSEDVKKFHARLDRYCKSSRLIMRFDVPFWTSPYTYRFCEEIAPDLYDQLKNHSALLLFKGDLNYRKLIGDRNWPYETSLKEAMADFQPGNVCTVRSVKADLIVDIDVEQAKEQMEDNFDDKTWMITGDYGLIQFCKKE